MKIGLSGPADLVRAWARSLEAMYAIKTREYPSRTVQLAIGAL